MKPTTGTSGLSLASNLLLTASAAFWIIVWWSLVNPQAPATINDAPVSLMSMMLAVLMGIGTAIAQPALLSPLIPMTPAGMMLQESQRKTVGFAALIVLSALLGKFSFDIAAAWWSSRLPDDPTHVIPVTVVMLFLFNGPAALMWSWSTPSQWAADIMQAHEVKKLRLYHKNELAMLETAFLQSMAFMTRTMENGMIRMLPHEVDRVAQIIEGFHVGQNETIDRVVHLLELKDTLQGMQAEDGDEVIFQQGNRLRQLLLSNVSTLEYKGDE